MAHGCTYCTDDFHCEKYTDEKYTSWCYGKDYPCKDRRITNADRIRAMTDDELVELFADSDCGYCRIHDFCVAQENGRNCEASWLAWLRQAVPTVIPAEEAT